MCGIAGYVERQGNHTPSVLKEVVGKMTACLSHRGPDDDGVWVDASDGIAFGHRRLAILDLSPTGRQPMQSPDGRFVITYNGEIYNYLELGKELQDLGHAFSGTSDTEVMLAAFLEWGLERSLTKFVGMFAFGLWDAKERELSLARDRVGEKPLYYGWCSSGFLFGSELKAFRAHPQWHGRIDRDVLALFFRHNYVPAPYSIYKGIRKLLPGTFLRSRIDAMDPGSIPEPVPYWQFGALPSRERGICSREQIGRRLRISTRSSSRRYLGR